ELIRVGAQVVELTFSRDVLDVGVAVGPERGVLGQTEGLELPAPYRGRLRTGGRRAAVRRIGVIVGVLLRRRARVPAPLAPGALGVVLDEHVLAFVVGLLAVQLGCQ